MESAAQWLGTNFLELSSIRVASAWTTHGTRGWSRKMGPEDELAAFIRQAIPSVWALELLLLLRRDQRAWTEAELVSELRASPTVVGNALGQLHHRELTLRQDDGCWVYRPASRALETLVDDLHATYRERPVTVINIISRPSPLQSLADAFKFRGGER
jgi:hypothetical protein